MNRQESGAPRKPKIANFDSATAMLRALASHLDDEDFIALGSFPRWATESLNAFLDARSAFDKIGMMLFSHGVRSIGLAGIADWDRALSKARTR